jgi:hypothetical protein
LEALLGESGDSVKTAFPDPHWLIMASVRIYQLCRIRGYGTLNKTMKPDKRQTKSKKWFWAGVVLLTISGLFWLFTLVGMLLDPSDALFVFIGSLILTILPVTIGLYGIKPDFVLFRYLSRWKRVLDDKFRDRTRERFCERLRTIGVSAEMCERGADEPPESLGCIEISAGLIRMINIWKESYVDNEGNWTVSYHTHYFIPDSHSTLGFGIKSIRVKEFPLFGRVKDVRWLGNDSEPSSIERLSADPFVRKTIMNSNDVRISSGNGCWTISTDRGVAPSSEVWECYQAIAGHLIRVASIRARWMA